MSKPPEFYRRFIDRYPDVGKAYEELGETTKKVGPLDQSTAELVKLGIAIGARHEGAVHSHARRSLDAGASADEVRHAVLLATTTLGFPAMMAALSWVEDILEE